MQKKIKDGYITAIIKDGDNDPEYNATKAIFDSAPEPGEGQIWMMKEDMTMELVDLPLDEDEFVDDDTVASELAELLGVD